MWKTTCIFIIADESGPSEPEEVRRKYRDYYFGKARQIQGVPVRLLGTRFKANNCIGEPGPQELYRVF
jgi:hypothetical protein